MPRNVLHILLALLFFSPSLSAKQVSNNSIPKPVLAEVEDKQLYQSKQWKRILHYRKGKSEIDDPSFFLSQNGKTNLKAELLASIKKLVNDKSNNEKSTLCYFPSRSTWIISQLPSIKDFIKIPECKQLNKELEALNAKRITLILASAHINSPASAFGHTFLRIDASEDTTLASYAVNYAAQTTETNGIIYAYQGLSGGYKGKYSIEPYSKKLKTYSDLEQRDIWEYPLNLSTEELNKLILHIFEIRHFYADYYFLSENCSYNLLWLIEVAKDDVELVTLFNHKAIPIDTLRAIVNAGLVKETVYRPSKRKKILQKSKAIEKNPKAIEFAMNKKYQVGMLDGLSTFEKANALELASFLLQTDFAKDKITKKQYLGTYLTLLKERSSLGKIENKPIQAPISPLSGHKSTKLTFSLKSNGDALLRAKIAYHDIYDNDAGYIPGAYINFFDTAVAYSDNKLELEEINLLDIRSYAIQDAIFKPVSWQISVGGKKGLNDKLDPYFKVGAGLTLGNDKLYSYTMISPSFYLRDSNQQSISANIGVIYNPSPSLKLGLQVNKEWFTGHKNMLELEPFVTRKLTKNTALNLKYMNKEINGKHEENTTLSLFWYF